MVDFATGDDCERRRWHVSATASKNTMESAAECGEERKGMGGDCSGELACLCGSQEKRLDDLRAS